MEGWPIFTLVAQISVGQIDHVRTALTPGAASFIDCSGSEVSQQPLL